MNRTNKPTQDGYYWYIPQYLIEQGGENNESSWTIELIIANSTRRVGIFVGPLEAPIDNEKNEYRTSFCG